MNEQLKAVEAEIYPQRKSKRIHIAELQAAWAVYTKTLEPKEALWDRFFNAIGKFLGASL